MIDGSIYLNGNMLTTAKMLFPSTIFLFYYFSVEVSYAN